MEADSCSPVSLGPGRSSGALQSVIVSSGKFNETLQKKNVDEIGTTKGLESPGIKVWVISPRKEHHPSEMLTGNKGNMEGGLKEGNYK